MFLLGVAILIPNNGKKLLLKVLINIYELHNCYLSIYLNYFHVHFYNFINQGVLFYWYKEVSVSV